VSGEQEAIFMTPPTCGAGKVVIGGHDSADTADSMAPTTSAVAERSRILVMLLAEKTCLSILFGLRWIARLSEQDKTQVITTPQGRLFAIVQTPLNES
jgi:hypothetical protein